jgi:hypothetical protein
MNDSFRCGRCEQMSIEHETCAICELSLCRNEIMHCLNCSSAMHHYCCITDSRLIFCSKNCKDQHLYLSHFDDHISFRRAVQEKLFLNEPNLTLESFHENISVCFYLIRPFGTSNEVIVLSYDDITGISYVRLPLSVLGHNHSIVLHTGNQSIWSCSQVIPI